VYFYGVKVHEKFMQRCIQLAKNGLGTTYPNPMVGAVLVDGGEIIGEGWHERAGGPHAEVRAIDQVSDPDRLKSATLYVSLEPCSHHGRTPPCADLIIKMGIPNVVIGSVDPNPEVSGNGIAKLQAAGCAVTKGVLKESCDQLNRRFFTFHQKRRPYITLKWAQTANGYIAAADQTNNSGPVWISGPLSRQHAHKLRANEQAILVGAGTVLKDNPSLTTRHWAGANPLRVVIDPKGLLPKDRHIFNHKAPTLYVSRKSRSDLKGTRQLVLSETATVLDQVLDELYQSGIQSLVVEGGAQTLAGFIEHDLWDEAFIYSGIAHWDSGLRAPVIGGSVIGRNMLRDDLLTHLKNTAS
jgi:diaminohydroxyphosphoribosylaminopyrimidine deaminase/5-amino-6-(5-phosphoribosylamino)uracil reductase